LDWRDPVYHMMKGREQWSDVVWNAGFRNQISQLPVRIWRVSRKDTFGEAETLRTQNVYRLNVNVLYPGGQAGRITLFLLAPIHGSVPDGLRQDRPYELPHKTEYASVPWWI
jgi:hypothetical protein